ncbi:hypothetical protein HK407_01g02470 [Ordospora pajunii]|uniref:uncharacterized protein n=1 Tax=Ordospora pajunii TaxID=3039483 RepID=UPI00295273ED|nr:uncharacterized protein HK407_01g02470 [Ordospora pajunii]KAH9412352.1 hypothetical protein HK407_01g02470 [Ordospora pajunii]
MDEKSNTPHESCLEHVYVPEAQQLLLLKNIRDRIVCNEKEKTLLFETGFIETLSFSNVSELECLYLDILSLLATSRNTEIKQDVRGCIDRVFCFLSSSGPPLTKLHASMFRSFRVMLSETGADLLHDCYFDFFLSVIENTGDALYSSIIRNEVIELFCRVVDVDCRITRRLGTEKTIRALCSPEINSTKLLSKLISESTWQYVKIEHLLGRINELGSRCKLDGISCCVKIYNFSGKRDNEILERLVYELNALSFDRKEVLVLIGHVSYANMHAQMLFKNNEVVSRLVSRACHSKPSEISTEIFFCIYCLTSVLEESRKIIAKSKLVPAVFVLLKQKIEGKTFDSAFAMAVLLLKNVTRSVTLLRSDFLDCPIVETLINILEHSLPETIDGVSAIMPENEVCIGIVEQSVLKILANLVMEYGDYKSKFVALGGVEIVLRYVERFPCVVLHLFKNFLYNATTATKETFIKKTHRLFFGIFFEIYEQKKDLMVLGNCFNVIRNLLCDDSLDYIVHGFEGIISQIFVYLEKFGSIGMIEEGSNDEWVMLQIMYCIVNLSTGSDKFKKVVLNSKHLDGMKRICTTRNLCIAFVWIIINLSWREDGFENRVEALRENGIKEWILGLDVKDSVFADKIGTALENLRLA